MTQSRWSNEAPWWTLFSGGGVLAALCVPGLILATGFILPTTDGAAAADRHERLQSLVGIWPVRIALFGILLLTLFHCAHRIRHTLMDLGLRGAAGPVAALSYGSAVVGSVFAAVALLNL